MKLPTDKSLTKLKCCMAASSAAFRTARNIIEMAKSDEREKRWRRMKPLRVKFGRQPWINFQKISIRIFRTVKIDRFQFNNSMLIVVTILVCYFRPMFQNIVNLWLRRFDLYVCVCVCVSRQCVFCPAIWKTARLCFLSNWIESVTHQLNEITLSIFIITIRLYGVVGSK